MKLKNIIFTIFSVIFISVSVGIVAWIIKKETAEKTDQTTEKKIKGRGYSKPKNQNEKNIESKDKANEALAEIDEIMQSIEGR